MATPLIATKFRFQDSRTKLPPPSLLSQPRPNWALIKASHGQAGCATAGESGSCELRSNVGVAEEHLRRVFFPARATQANAGCFFWGASKPGFDAAVHSRVKENGALGDEPTLCLGGSPSPTCIGDHPTKAVTLN